MRRDPMKSCEFNTGVDCEEYIKRDKYGPYKDLSCCETCGWNPDVAAYRTMRINRGEVRIKFDTEKELEIASLKRELQASKVKLRELHMESDQAKELLHEFKLRATNAEKQLERMLTLHMASETKIG